ncbi:MAG: electron transfer flavoprotein subunit beta/FixA family protein [Acidimicrobiia bacterium]|nr:electron transfer flavoprotein subunit beta/FixA family protein [Acidimicrobiia bacterium]
MNIVVLVKQIPDPAGPQELNADHTLKREGKLILDESDSYGVEIALQLRESAGGGDVTLVSMAPNGETSGLRTALAMGADDAILVGDDALPGAAALTTAKVLAGAIGRKQYDLVIGAVESSDGYVGVVPAMIAELLGLPSLTFAKKIDIDGSVIRIERQTEAGYDEVEGALPALVSVTAGVVEPRYPSFKGIMAAKKKPLEQVTVADLGVSVPGFNGNEEVTSVEDAPARAAGEKIEDDGTAFERIVAFLDEQKVL